MFHVFRSMLFLLALSLSLTACLPNEYQVLQSSFLASKEAPSPDQKHHFVTAAELALWSDRAKNGPFKHSDDAFVGSLPVFSNLQYGASKLEDKLDQIVLKGTCIPIESDTPSTMIPASEFGSVGVARDAAFVDMVEGTTKCHQQVKSLLLSQALEPCMDFSNRNLYPYYNKDGVWLYAEWLHRVLLAYDYLGSNSFSSSEKKIMDTWFWAAADWLKYSITERSMNNLYSPRVGMPWDYLVDFNFWANSGIGRQVYKDSGLFHAPSLWINNRQLGIANYIAHVGVILDDNHFKEVGAQLVREYISFHFDDNGYYAELERATLGSPLYGLAYGANSLVNIAEIAHILHSDGYENLFEFQSSVMIDEATGDIKQSLVTKDLEWIVLKFRENFMLANSPALYPLGNQAENSNQIMHLCDNTGYLGMDVVGRFYSGAAIVNRYYKNEQIKDIYASEYGNMCGFISNNNIYHGPNGVAPSFLFQYADVR